jgi:hypothetical protein
MQAILATSIFRPLASAAKIDAGRNFSNSGNSRDLVPIYIHQGVLRELGQQNVGDKRTPDRITFVHYSVPNQREQFNHQGISSRKETR